MARRDQQEWVNAKEAALIISRKSGHEVKQPYIRWLALQGKIAQRPVDKRTNEYRRSDVDRIRVHERKVPGRGKKAPAEEGKEE